ncbi:hypothetical protein Goklo_021177, partial [Gossypium klotzschianum]|nr:hypothetical protein [Gossypium klotzschianum]
KIIGVPPPHPSPGPDQIICGATSTSSFSLKSTYEKVHEGTFNLKERLWEIPWKFHGPHQIRFFIWLALKQRPLTNAERVRCKFWSSSACSLYGHGYEDVLHILRDYEEQFLEPFFILGWNRLAMSLWDYRVVYLEESKPIHFPSTDGLVRFDEGFAADGGCVRDDNGEWITGFTKYLGNCTVLEVKLLGILDGLNLILDRHFEIILIQIDSIEAISVILEDSLGNSNSALVRKIHLILRKI